LRRNGFVIRGLFGGKNGYFQMKFVSAYVFRFVAGGTDSRTAEV
jgi:hypothetical protein